MSTRIQSYMHILCTKIVSNVLFVNNNNNDKPILNSVCVCAIYFWVLSFMLLVLFLYIPFGERPETEFAPLHFYSFLYIYLCYICFVQAMIYLFFITIQLALEHIFHFSFLLYLFVHLSLSAAGGDTYRVSALLFTYFIRL